MRVRNVLWGLLFLPSALVSQSPPTKDSLRAQLKRDSTYIFRNTFAKPYLKLENRNSFIQGERVTLLGFMLGATLLGRHTLALGYYVLDPRKIRSIPVSVDNTTVDTHVDLYYFPLDYQHILVSRRFIQLNIPVGIGYGQASVHFNDPANGETISIRENMWPVNGGVQLIVRPIRWLGVSGAGGYRYMLPQDRIKIDLSGWYFSYGIWVDARHLIRLAKYHYKKKEYRDRLKQLQ